MSSTNPNTNVSANHRRYKNFGLDPSELRRRREEEGIQLRKQKREEQRIKRRNFDINHGMENDIDSTVPVKFVITKSSINDVLLFSDIVGPRYHPISKSV